MKLAILASVLAATTAFIPATTNPARPGMTYLCAEEDASGMKGAEAISALTKDIETIFTVEDIAATLPHRYPFALVDKVIEYEAGKVSFVFIPGLSCARQSCKSHSTLLSLLCAI